MEKVTPMLRQYLEIKKSYPGTLLFFRLGDFYEMFNEDAVIGARELQITLTARQKDSPNPIPMCGVPHHAAASYISKLVRKGYRVAICEQAEPAGKGTKLVRREVVRVITPGTSIDEQLVEPTESIFLAAIAFVADRIGAAFLDISSGEILTTETEEKDGWEAIIQHIERFSPREILVETQHKHLISNKLGYLDLAASFVNENREVTPSPNGTSVTEIEGFADLKESAENLKRHFNVRELSGFGLDEHPAAVVAASECLRYAKNTQKTSAIHISELRFIDNSDFLVLDAVTLANLEILKPRTDGPRRTLISIIDETITAMGGRLLRSWLLRPLVKRSEIMTRQEAVAELFQPILREELRFYLKNVTDLERIIGRLHVGTMPARDLLALERSLAQVPSIIDLLQDTRSPLLQVLVENMFELPEIREIISTAIVDEPPANLSDGGIIRDGFNPELDELRSISLSVKSAIASFEQNERERSGISTLKVRYNNVFGYYIEVSKAQLSRAPDDYERRQTLANAERFTTPQLKEWEAKVLGAEEKIAAIESRIYSEILETVRNETTRLRSTARAFATLDALASLAETAARRNFVAPSIHESDEIEIVKGRHPVVEANIRDEFVPNDVYLNNSTYRLLVITGPNMGGKSTLLRQVALIQILAQIGSFVPAASARLPIVDRIWTRVGASDDLASGRSTFMVEMTETAAILHNATPRSLILLDEIGRGTSTFDGLSIAWAVAEYLHNSVDRAAKTIFATHYHELTELAENLPGAKNYQMAATEDRGDVVFLHRLEKGKASKSYGIAVAKLAGLPQPVIDRARSVLQKLEKYELAIFADEHEKDRGIATAAGRSATIQNSLFAIANEAVIEELRHAEIENLSPNEIKQLVEDIKRKIV
ncbi:DNA mismatch repair protein MutS [Leptolyngbya sp. 7M]|uniref:DNA mismatch repair protein MutS n=1 Tax=Leptolyngbya sp. 7M TaxID=2812896 RepID=UPI001B8C80D7|nr:DNA mismatch repair protein MutS [Leptolyngbya sp. 7M]QYO66515.1 DNA mismatch repair protein MutS [Leptolyngbya sp. 7M]